MPNDNLSTKPFTKVTVKIGRLSPHVHLRHGMIGDVPILAASPGASIIMQYGPIDGDRSVETYTIL